jgi:hypothetical protein
LLLQSRERSPPATFSAPAQVLSGEPDRVLQDLLRDWRPDLVVAQDGLLPHSWLLGAAETPLPDVLKIARPPLLAQLVDMVLPRAVRQA